MTSKTTLSVIMITSIVFGGGWAAASERVDTIRIVTQSLPPSLGLPYSANGSPSSYYWHALFDTLTEWDTEGVLVPALAKSWERRDMMTWAFTLRSSVYFSNGDVLNAESVAKNLNWLVQSDRGKTTLWSREINTVTAVSAESDLVILVHTSRPDPLIPNKFSGVFIIHPSGISDPDGTDAFAQNPVGTGPFALDKWRDSQGHTIMVAAPSGWRGASFRSLVLIPAPNALARVQAVAIGQGDLTGNVPGELLAHAESAGLNIQHIPMAAISSFMFRNVNNSNSAVNDVRVRQALNYAVNKEALSILLGGNPDPAGQASPSQVFGYNETVGTYPYDPDRARALLREAGYDHNNSIHLTLTVSTGEFTIGLLAQQIVQDARAVGVRVDLVNITAQQWLQQYTASSFKTDLFNLTWNSSPLNDASRPLEFTSCLRPKPFFCEQSIVALLEQARVEVNSDRRLALLHKAQSRVHDLAPAIFMFEHVIHAVSSPNIKKIPWRLTVPAYDLMELGMD